MFSNWWGAIIKKWLVSTWVLAEYIEKRTNAHYEYKTYETAFKYFQHFSQKLY